MNLVRLKCTICNPTLPRAGKTNICVVFRYSIHQTHSFISSHHNYLKTSEILCLRVSASVPAVEGWKAGSEKVSPISFKGMGFKHSLFTPHLQKVFHPCWIPTDFQRDGISCQMFDLQNIRFFFWNCGLVLNKFLLNKKNCNSRGKKYSDCLRILERL